MNERARLTALYGALLLLAGGALVALVYVLLRSTLPTTIKAAAILPVPGGAPAATTVPKQPFLHDERAETIRILGYIEEAALDRLLLVSLFAVAVFALVSVALAWWMSGRVLRPVAVITQTARRLSGENLHERIALDAPPGELKRLADTFDEMLDRIERLVSAQQRFAANVAHELRTPLAMQRAAAEIGLAGEPDAARVARIRSKLIEIAEDSERMIEGLLLLSVSEQGLQHREPVPMHEIARQVTREAGGAVTGGPLVVHGDPVLLARLTHNLVANAVRYNRPGGIVKVGTGADGLTVSNTGPEVPADVVPLLFEPFRRLNERQHTPGEGVGLGLSIVAAIARAHGGGVTATPNPGGGLTVHVTFAEQDRDT